MSQETNESWPGFSEVEALDWSRVIVHYSPEPLPAIIKAHMYESIKQGNPVVDAKWVRTADRARGCGFTPILYHSLFKALYAIDPSSFKSHPKHREVTQRNRVPGIPFEAELWYEWPRMVVKDGFSPGTAAELVLLFARSH